MKNFTVFIYIFSFSISQLFLFCFNTIISENDINEAKSFEFSLNPSTKYSHNQRMQKIIKSIDYAVQNMDLDLYEDKKINEKSLKNRIPRHKKGDGDDKIKANFYFVYFYTICIDIGSYKHVEKHNQEFCVIVDTGSSDLQVLDKNVAFNININRSLNSFYNINESITGQRDPNADYVTINYYKGRTVGIPTHDVVKINETKVWDQGFLSAIKVADFNMDIPRARIDGILGLAFKEMADSGFNPLIDTMYYNKIINKRRFSFDFINKKKGARFIIGDSDKKLTQYGSTKLWIRKTKRSQSYQLVSIDSASIQNNEYNNEINLCNNCDAILDTGTSFLAVPKKIYKLLTKILFEDRLNKEQNYDVNEKYDGHDRKECQMSYDKSQVCRKSYLSKMPKLKFTFNQVDFIFEPKDYMMTIKSDFNEYISPRFFEIEWNMWILGLTQFEKIYTTFDYTDSSSPYVLLANPNPHYQSFEQFDYVPAQSTRIIMGSIFAGIAFIIAVIVTIILFIKQRRSKSPLKVKLKINDGNELSKYLKIEEEVVNEKEDKIIKQTTLEI